jgi:hypothetical protein
MGVVRLENDFAADRRARNDAVKFDLKADLRRGGSIPLEDCLSVAKSVFRWNTLKSSSSTSISSKGWSSTAFSPGDVG